MTDPKPRRSLPIVGSAKPETKPAEPTPKRRLVVLQDNPEAGLPPRPASHVVALCAIATLLGWLLLAALINLLLRGASAVVLVVVNALGLFLASVAAGFVGRQFAPPDRRWNSASGAALACIFATGAVFVQGGFRNPGLWLAVLLLLGVLAGAGAYLGYVSARRAPE